MQMSTKDSYNNFELSKASIPAKSGDIYFIPLQSIATNHPQAACEFGELLIT
jgi:hypothetical protein